MTLFFKDSGFKLILLVLLVFFLVSISASDVHADVGAKPSIEIHLVNEPNQHFYLALLTREGRRIILLWLHGSG